MTNQPTTASRAEAVAAWTLHYEANPGAAKARLADMRANGVPEGHTAEKLGAFLALTPREHRCAHWGDDRYCSQCVTEKWAEEDATKREQRAARRMNRRGA
jgi:hypothetical protein